ncbi:hypothetical protein Ahy_A07g032923 [Arachis hypogaea]|uniref:Zinc finger GRF-type domain-containing protein n=1 Tax=Arachis hypogaea TaxID=3818 RepID=A0A445C843_ARAHY|nr:hypothetical protein Ahy_A07g032923 [Arachis hypogaea]
MAFFVNMPTLLSSRLFPWILLCWLQHLQSQTCGCGTRPVLRWSGTDSNPERPFFGCPNYNVVWLFLWVDKILKEDVITCDSRTNPSVDNEKWKMKISEARVLKVGEILVFVFMLLITVAILLLKLDRQFGQLYLAQISLCLQVYSSCVASYIRLGGLVLAGRVLVDDVLADGVLAGWVVAAGVLVDSNAHFFLLFGDSNAHFELTFSLNKFMYTVYGIIDIKHLTATHMQLFQVESYDH